MGTNGANADIKAMFKKPNPQKASQGPSKKSSVKQEKPSKKSQSNPKSDTHKQPSNANQSKPAKKVDSQKKPFKPTQGKPPKPTQGKPSAEKDSQKKPFQRKPSATGEKKATWQKKRKAPVPAAPKSKKELRAAKKARNAERTHGAELSKANEVWNVFNNTEIKKSERKIKFGEILKELEGKMYHVCFKHDGSRAVQKLIKYGTVPQREQIYNELKGKMVELSLDKHAHFIVIQLLKCDVEDIRKAVMQELMKRVVKLALHNTAGSVIDYMYASGKPKDRLRILAEFYGKEYALFAKLDESDTVKTLSEVLASNPDKASVVLSSIQTHVDKCSTKDMFLFRPLHGLLAAYLPHALPISREQLISICSGKVLALHHSQEGAALVCECLGQGTAKTRKAVVKGLKGRVNDVACNPYGHVILIRALQVIDDTALLNSGILSELKKNVEELLVDPSGVKVLLFAATPQLAGLSTESDRQLLAPALKDGEATSKKNPIVRRTEIFLQTISWLLPAIQTHLNLISHPLACKVIFETLMHAYYVSDPIFATTEGKSVAASDLNKLLAVRAPLMQTVEAIAKMFSDEANLALVEDSNINHHLKRLFNKTQPTGKNLAETFSNTFLPLISQSTLPAAWLSNRGAFLMATIAESDESFKAPLKSHLGEIKKVDSAGTKLLAQVLEETAAQREQRLASHKDDVAQSEGPTKELKKKKKKPKKRPVVEGEYKDPAIVGKKASKSIKILSLGTAEKEAKKAKSNEAGETESKKGEKAPQESKKAGEKRTDPKEKKGKEEPSAKKSKPNEPTKPKEQAPQEEAEGEGDYEDGYEGDEYGGYEGDEYDLGDEGDEGN